MRTKENNAGKVLKSIKTEVVIYIISLLSVVPALYFLADNNAQLTPDKISRPPCNEIDWTVWGPIAGKNAAGTINSQGKDVSVTMNAAFEFEAAPNIERYDAFKRFKAPISNATVPRTSWSEEPGGIITICFSQTVKEPVLLLASLGSYKNRIETTISFSEPYIMLYNAGGMIVDNNNTLTGREGYALIKFPGNIKCITINSSTYENFTDLTWGIPVCPDGTPKPASVLIAADPEAVPVAASKPPVPSPQPVAALPKPVAAVAAAKPKPAPVPVAVPKPAAIPEPPSQPVVALPEPVPAVAAVKPKPAPVLAAAPKPAPVPELPSQPVAALPEPVPAIAAVKPEPVPIPVAVLKPAPVQELQSQQIAALPKPVAAVAASKPKPTPVPVAVPKPAAVPGPPSQPVAVVKPKPVTGADIHVPARKIVQSPKPDPKRSVETNPRTALGRNNHLKVRIWDFDGMDYDSVSLKLNGKQVGPEAILLPLYKLYGSSEFTYSLDLAPGNNTLEIYAISEGLKPFITIGLLIMYDDVPKKLYYTLKAREATVIRL